MPLEGRYRNWLRKMFSICRSLRLIATAIFPSLQCFPPLSILTFMLLSKHQLSVPFFLARIVLDSRTGPSKNHEDRILGRCSSPRSLGLGFVRKTRLSLSSGGLDLYRWENPPCTLHSQGEPAFSGLCIRSCGQREGEARIPRGTAAPGNYPTMIYCCNSPGSSRLRGGSCKWVNRKEI